MTLRFASAIILENTCKDFLPDISKIFETCSKKLHLLKGGPPSRILALVSQNVILFVPANLYFQHQQH